MVEPRTDETDQGRSGELLLANPLDKPSPGLPGCGIEAASPAKSRISWRASLALGRTVLYCFVGLILLYSIAPTFVVIPISFSDYEFLRFPPDRISLRWYENYFSSSRWIDPTIKSAIVAPLVVALSVPLGALGAYSLVRGRYPGRNLITALTISPLIVPQLVTAVGIYFLFLKVHLVGTLHGFVLAHSVLALPFTVVIMTATLQSIDETLERAAMSLGARHLTVLRRVTFPLAMPGIVTSVFFSFLISFDELLIAIFISTARFNTLPRQMWNTVRQEVDPTIAAVATMLIMLTILVLTLAWILRRWLVRHTMGTG